MSIKASITNEKATEIANSIIQDALDNICDSENDFSSFGDKICTPGYENRCGEETEMMTMVKNYDNAVNEMEKKNKNIEINNLYKKLEDTTLQLLDTQTELELYKQRDKEANDNNKRKKEYDTPNIIIIVPYRDRAAQRCAFMRIMPYILEKKNYEIYFIHQRDRRPFNRGAMKNLGFLHAKNKYGTKCKNINIVFHDIDIIPWWQGQFSYETKLNIVNHFYGFEFALGGILAIKGLDFDKINGFPNIWTWGLEDNVLQKRCYNYGVHITRNEFVSIDKNNKNIISLWHGWERLISPNIEPKWKFDNGIDGIRSIKNIKMTEKKIKHRIFEINVYSFETGENMNSPFVKNAKIRNSREFVRQNQPINFSESSLDRQRSLSQKRTNSMAPSHHFRKLMMKF